MLNTKSLFGSFMIIEKCQTKEELVTYIEKIIEKEAISMSPLTKMLLDLEMKGIIRGVKNMLQLGEKDEKIEKYMGITREELENIKQMIAN